MNGNLNAALIFLDRALEEIERGFIACARCGDQEDTKDLDFVDDIKMAKAEVLVVLSREIDAVMCSNLKLNKEELNAKSN